MTGGSLSSEVRIEAGWAAFTTGFTPNDDYNPTVSSDVSPALAAELAGVFQAFHPHNQIGQFPTDRPVFLFWKAKSGGYVVARILPAANNRGVRKALEYLALVLDADCLSDLGNNPLRSQELGLFEFVREQIQAGSQKPLRLGISADVARPLPKAEMRPERSENRLQKGDNPATPENARELEAYVTRLAENGRVPPGFASWWEAGKPVPAGIFDFVLRARAIQGTTLKDISEAVTELVQTVQASLPNIPASDAQGTVMMTSLLDEARELERTVLEVARGINGIDGREFKERMGLAAAQADQLASSLTALLRRLGRDFNSRERAALEELTARCTSLARDIPRVMHPNPFARERATASPARFGFSGGTTGRAEDVGERVTKPANSAPRTTLAVITLSLVGLIGGATYAWVHWSNAQVPQVPTEGDPKARGIAEEDHSEHQGKLPHSGAEELRKQIIAHSAKLLKGAVKHGHKVGFERTQRIGGEMDPKTQRQVEYWSALVLNYAYHGEKVLPTGVNLNYDTWKQVLNTDDVHLLASVREAVTSGRRDKVKKLINQRAASLSGAGAHGRGTGAGHGATGAGHGATGAGHGATGAGHGATGAGHGATGAGHGATGTAGSSGGKGDVDPLLK